MQNPILVLDNGGATIKAGMVSSGGSFMYFSMERVICRTMPNTTGRIKKSLHELVGDETVSSISDYSQLMYHRPIEKYECIEYLKYRGYLVNWDHEAKIWHRLFDAEHLNIVLICKYHKNRNHKTHSCLCHNLCLTWTTV